MPVKMRFKKHDDAREKSYIPFSHPSPQNAGYNISLKEVKKQKIRDAALQMPKKRLLRLLRALLRA
jgi:hypothetical protein